MKRFFIGLGYAVAGLVLAVTLTAAAYAIGGRELSRPARQVRLPVEKIEDLRGDVAPAPSENPSPEDRPSVDDNDGDEDNSGSGSSNSGSGSSNSGSGSSNSGSGSGDDEPDDD